MCGDDDRDHDVADHDNHEQVNTDLELQPMPMCVSMMMLLLMIIIYQGLSMCLIKIGCYTMYSSYNINIIYMMMILVMMITICTNCILIYYKQQGSSLSPSLYGGCARVSIYFHISSIIPRCDRNLFTYLFNNQCHSLLSGPT